MWGEGQLGSVKERRWRSKPGDTGQEERKVEEVDEEEEEEGC
jgi:hypothetical protein